MACPHPSELQRRSELSPERARELDRHLDECSACRARAKAPDSQDQPTINLRPQDSPRPRAVPTPAPAQAKASREAGLGVESGTRIGRYLALEEVGRGGMGVVFRAHDPELNRPVAIKLLSSELFDERQREALRARMLKEAQAMARLSHPNVVSVFDVGMHDDSVFIAMELVPGQTLDRWLSAKPRELHEVLRVFKGAGAGLRAAHKAGLVHRDFKPSNVLVGEDGSVRVSDFGLARVDAEPILSSGSTSPIDASAAETLTGATMGTPAYMAPEQHRGGFADARSDQYSFCVALYEALCKERPTQGVQTSVDTPMHEGRARPETFFFQLPRWLRHVLRRGLAAEPSARYASMDELLRALDDGPRLSRRLVVAVLGAGASVVALGAVVGRFAYRRAQGPVSVLVADATNSTLERELDDLSGLLITALEQSRRLKVFTRKHLVDQLRARHKDVVERIDAAMALDLARELGADVVLVSAVWRFSDSYVLQVDVHQVAGGRLLFGLKKESAVRTDIPGTVDALSEELREKLDEGREEIRAARVRVSDATTGNLEAYHYFARGERMYDDLNIAGAEAQYRRAIELDSSFAMAHYRLATCLQWNYLPGGKEAIDRAAALSGRVAPKERDLIVAFKAMVDGDDAAAFRGWKAVLERYPNEREAAWWIADRLFHTFRATEAIPHFERVVELAPRFTPGTEHLLRALWVVENYPRALAVAERKENAVRSTDVAVANAYMRRYDEWERLVRKGGDTIGWVEGLLFQGRLDEAVAVATEARAQPEGAPRRRGAQALARTLAHQGRYGEALELLHEAVHVARQQEDRQRLAQLHSERAVLFQGLDDAAGAREALVAAREHERFATVHIAWAFFFAAHLCGEDASETLVEQLKGALEARLAKEVVADLARGDFAKAVPKLEEAAFGMVGAGGAVCAFELARAALEAKDYPALHRACDRFERLFPDFHIADSGLSTLLRHRVAVLRAQGLERSGRAAEAARQAHKALSALSRADPKLRALGEAKAIAKRP